MATRTQGSILGDLLDAGHRSPHKSTEVRDVPVRSIAPNPYNPRRSFDEREIAVLAASIKQNGLLQPIIVRPSPTGLGFELVSGQRRLLAFGLLGKESIPAVIRELDDRTTLAFTIVENIQRQDLNIIEIAEGYHQLTTTFGLTQSEVAQLVGKSRSAVANILRVRRLPFPIRLLLREGRLKEGHARVLLSVEHPGTQLRLAQAAARESWTMKELSRAAHHANRKRRNARASRAKDEVVQIVDERFLKLSQQWGVSIELFKTGDKGEIHLMFDGHEDFERLFKIITGRDVADVV